MHYTIWKNNVQVGRKAAEIKRKIKNNKLSEGIFLFKDRKSNTVFTVEYKTILVKCKGGDMPRIIGKQIP
jgi:hypothetical protein